MRAKTILVGGLAAMFTLALLSACGGEQADPIEGDWESRAKVDGKRNQLLVQDNGGSFAGQAAVYAYTTMTYEGQSYQLLTSFDFDATVEARGNGRYRIKLLCNKLCLPELSSECYYGSDVTDYDAELDCRMGSLEDELECDASDAWSGYEFEWRKR